MIFRPSLIDDGLQYDMMEDTFEDTSVSLCSSYLSLFSCRRYNDQPPTKL